MGRKQTERNWLASLAIETKTSFIISEQAKYGWLFDSGRCRWYIEKLSRDMQEVDDSLRDQLPIYVKQYGVTVKEPFKLDGNLKKMASDWMDTNYDNPPPVEGPFSRIFFEPMNLGSNDQVKEFLLTLGWKPTWWNIRKKTTDKGKAGERTSPKISDNGHLCPNLETLDSDLGKQIVLYLKCKHRKGLLEGLLKVVRPDGRISGEANPQGAASHRMTHRKIVNIPGAEAFYGKEIRSLFVSKEGYKIVGCDSKSNQARMLCHYMGDDAYTHEVIHGDIHTANQRAAGLEKRSQAKTFFYAFLFGAGDPKIGKVLDRSTAEGRKVKQKFFRALPKLALLANGIKARVRKLGFFFGLDGRKVWCTSEHKALNYLLQGGEAVYMKYAMCFLHKAIEREGLDAHFVATIHDEFQLEVREDHVERVKELCLDIMVKTGHYLGISVPMEGDVKVGDNWYETH